MEDWVNRLGKPLESLHTQLMNIGYQPRAIAAAVLLGLVVVFTLHNWDGWGSTWSTLTVHFLGGAGAIFASVWLATHNFVGDSWVVAGLLVATLMGFISSLVSLEQHKRLRALLAAIAMIAALSGAYLLSGQLYRNGSMAYFLGQGSAHVNWVTALALMPLVIISALYVVYWLLRTLIRLIRNRQRSSTSAQPSS